MLKAEEVFHIVERKFFSHLLIYKNPEMKIQDLVHVISNLNHIRFKFETFSVLCAIR
jgi:hypothetical protein